MTHSDARPDVIFVSHVEAIEGRSPERVLQSIANIMAWNDTVIRSVPGAEYLILTDVKCTGILSRTHDFRFRDVAGLQDRQALSVQLLKAAYDSVDIKSKWNFGYEFELKCFERFLYARDLFATDAARCIVHVDGDLALGREFVADLVTRVRGNGLAGVISPSRYGTYLSGFRPADLETFCTFILKDYFHDPDAKTYRICDMGAFCECLERGDLLRDEALFAPFRAYLSTLHPEHSGFYKITRDVAGKCGIEMKSFWEALPEPEIAEIARHPDFFRMENGRDITWAGAEIPFLHFHGWLKSFASHLL